MVTINMNSGVYKCMLLCIKLSIGGIIALGLAMAFEKYGVPSEDYITWAKTMSLILFAVSGMAGMLGVIMKSLINALESLDDFVKDARSEFKNWKNGFTKV